MDDIVTLTLPTGASARLVREFQDAVCAVPGVEECGELGTRSVEGTTGVWVKLAAEPEALDDMRIAVVREIVALLRQRDLTGVKVILSDGVIEPDGLDLDEIEHALARLKPAAA